MCFSPKQLIAVLSIFYISAIEMFLAFGSTIVLDFLFLKHMRDEVKENSTPLLLLNAGLYMGLLMSIVYYGRMLLKMIPFPLEGAFGFKSSSIEEFVKLEAFLVFAVFYWDGLTEIVNELRVRIIS